MASQAVVSSANHEVSSNKRLNNCPSPSNTDIDDSQQKNCDEQSFNNSANNSSGLGDSISMPCLLNECSSSSSSSSVYDGSNTVNNVIYSSSGSLPETPTSSNTSGIDFSKINTDTANLTNSSSTSSSNPKDFSKTDASFQKSDVSSRSDYSPLKNAQFGNSLGQQLNSLNLNDVDYSPFNDYMGIDKMILQMAVADGQKSKGNFNLDPQHQQQIIAQALAAVASSSNNNNNSNTNEISNKPTSRSITENIELLNSKLLSHKTQNNSSDKYLDNPNNISNSINNGLNLSNQNNIQNNSDSYSAYNSSNLPVNLKRQSYPQANQNSNSHIFGSTTSNNIHNLLNSGSSAQSSLNNRLNSNLLVNEQQTSNKYSQSHDKQATGSLSASNSSFNFNANGSNDVDLSSRNNQCSFSGNNSNCYEDDDVFSSNNSFNSSFNQSIRNENNNNQSTNSNLDTVALAQLYRSFLNNGNNSTSNNNNSNSNNNNNNNNRNDNMNELLSSYNSNLTALSLNPDLINSNSFLNSTNSIANQLKNMSNNSLNSSNSNNFSNKNSNIDQIAAALLKQRQNLLHANRSSSSSINNSSTNNPSSNIAALTSATSNIASLLNLNNNSHQQNSQHFQQVFGDQKRRMNSNTNVTGNGNNSLGSIYSNNSLFNTNVGPNASHLLQNSSLASSARLNSATSSSAAASVLGNNSSLHALSSLQHQSNSNSLNNSQNNHQSIFNSSSNNNGNGNNMQHQSNLLNFNMSPSSASNHGILSALSLSSTTGSSLQNQLLSASGKPLRSERLPSHYVEEIVKQAKIRRRNGGKKEVCVFCRNNGEKEQIYTSHTLKDASNHVACPILRQYQCPICRASGDMAHTIKYCPYAEKDSNCIKLFKENGRMSAAAALLMNSLAGGNASPHSLSPPSTPPPSHTSHSLMHQNLGSLDIQSPSHHNSLNAYLNSSLNFDLSSSNNCKNNESGSSLNKSFSSNCSSILNSTQNSNYAKSTTNSLLTSRDSNSSLLSSNFSNNLNK